MDAGLRQSASPSADQGKWLMRIAADAFDGSPEVLIVISEGSAAQDFARQHHISCTILNP